MMEVAEKKALVPYFFRFLLCALCEGSVTSVLLTPTFFSGREEFRLVLECSSQPLRALCGQKPLNTEATESPRTPC